MLMSSSAILMVYKVLDGRWVKQTNKAVFVVHIRHIFGYKVHKEIPLPILYFQSRSYLIWSMVSKNLVEEKVLKIWPKAGPGQAESGPT